MAFVLTFAAGFPFYPFMLMAMLALGFYLWRWPASNQRQAFWIQFGIFNGVLVSFWYVCMFIIVATGKGALDWKQLFVSAFSLCALMLIPLVVWIAISLTKWLCRVLRQPFWRGTIILVLLYGIGMIASSYRKGTDFREALLQPFVVPYVMGLIFAPVWSLTAYGFAAFRLLTVDRSRTQFRFLQLMTYVAGLITAVRASIWLSLHEYSQLPVEKPPGCYVATAAAQGHAGVVRRFRQDPFPVNRQLQVLKAFELALLVLCPWGHRWLRRCYDMVGPPVAKRIDRPWKADLAFLLLQPAAWLAELMLCALLGHRRWVITTLYGRRFNRR
jgi:hypothetical protein